MLTQDHGNIDQDEDMKGQPHGVLRATIDASPRMVAATLGM
jgi:hypothetical protein